MNHRDLSIYTVRPTPKNVAPTPLKHPSASDVSFFEALVFKRYLNRLLRANGLELDSSVALAIHPSIYRRDDHQTTRSLVLVNSFNYRELNHEPRYEIVMRFIQDNLPNEWDEIAIRQLNTFIENNK